ncbi:hypothetical protein BC830DRAFT_420704 [Chytriomyces sp. MP71]|nr:hypothetical protein BC830DRAFT_420704 [Chytriomyces sp. MP71]
MPLSSGNQESDDSIVWFQTVLNWFSPEKLIGTNQILYDVLTGVMGLTLLNAAWVGYSFSQNRFRFIWTLKTLRVTLGLFSTVLFIPILAFFTDQISNCRSEDGSDLNCWSGGDLFQSIVTLVIMLLFVGLALAVKATFFEPDPTAKDVTSRPHSRLDMLYVLFRATLTVLSIALGTGQQYGSEFSQSATNIQALLVNNTSQTNGSSNILNSSTQPETHRRDNGTTQTHETELWVMTMACVILSFTLASMYIWYIPFYNYRYSVLRAGMMVNFFWASLCMVYTNSFPGSDIGIAFLLFSPLSFVFAYYFVKLRRSLIDGMPFNTINDPLTVELKIRFKLLERGILFRDKVKTAGARYPGDAGGATGATTGTPVPNLSGAGCPDSAALEAAERVFLDEINQLYIQSIKMLPKSCRMYLLASSFQLIFLKNRAQCLAFTAKAALMMPKLDEAFMIFKRQRLLNDRFAGGDVIDFIAYEQNMKLAKINERKATIAGLQFWSELMKKYPSFYKLQTHGAAISSAVSLAQLHYITLIKLTPDSSDVYRLYGRFLINVLNDKKSGQELLDHAEELDDESLNQSEGSDDDGSVGSSPEYSDEEDTPRKSKATNLFCNDNCVITISGEQQNLGHMLSMNPNAMKLFGYKKNEWVGRNISAIVPSPFSEAHDGFLIKYLETGYAKVIERTRDVLGLHKEGFLIPMSLCVKHVVESNGKQTFVGIIKPSKPSASNGHLIFYSADQKIKHVTQNVANLFNYVPDKTKETFLYEWIPGISIEAIESKAGFISEFVTQEAIVKMKLSGEKLTIGETSAYICKAHINRRPHPKTTNADASMSPTSLPDELGESLEDVGAVPLVFSAHNSKADLASTGNQEVSQWTEATGEVISTKSISFDDLEKGAAIRVNHNLKKTKSESAKKLKEDKVDSSYSKSSSARNVKKIISNRSQHSNKQLNYIHAAFIEYLHRDLQQDQ